MKTLLQSCLTTASVATFFLLAHPAVAAPGDHDNSFDSQDTLPSSNVYAVALQPDGRILVGGAFTNVGDDEADYICRFNTDGTLDTSFAPVDILNNSVYAIAVQPDGRILVGGDFTDVGGDDDFICRLEANGSHDPSFDPENLLDDRVRCISLQPGGQMFLGGSFDNVGGMGDNRICRLNANGSHDTGFSPGGTIALGVVESIAVQADGKLILGGSFSNIPFGTGDDDKVCRLEANGSHDASFNPKDTIGDTVNSVVLQPDGKVLVAGLFTDVDGTEDRICRLDSNGILDPLFTPGDTFGARIDSLALQADGKVIAGGFFQNAPSGTGEDSRVARLQTDGTHDSGFKTGSTFNSTVRGLALQKDGSLLAGGIFVSAPGGTGDDDGIARLLNEYATDELSVVSSSWVSWSRAGSAPEAARVHFSYSTDSGSSWISLGEGVRVSEGWEIKEVSIPSPSIVRGHAFIPSGWYNGSSGIVEAIATWPATPSATTAPTLQVRGKRSLKTTRSRIVLRGTASDPDGDLSEVRYRDSRPKGRRFRKVRGLGNWKATVVLKNGSNVVKVQAFDAVGMSSSIQRIRIRRTAKP